MRQRNSLISLNDEEFMKGKIREGDWRGGEGGDNSSPPFGPKRRDTAIKIN